MGKYVMTLGTGRDLTLQEWGIKEGVYILARYWIIKKLMVL
jgi:hypothetical protein